jgi:aspartyl-tRNA synthetase
MVFIHLRQRTDSVQSVLSVEEGKVSKFMVKWASQLADESIVLVEGIVQKSPEEIKSATIKDVELKLTRVRTQCQFLLSLLNRILQIHLISGLDGRLPFSLDDASRPDTEKDEKLDTQFNRVLLDTRLNNRVVDLRVRHLTIVCA